MDTWTIAVNSAQIVSAIATAGAFIALFRRDRAKQDQLDKLASIAQSQKEISDAQQRNEVVLQKQGVIMQKELSEFVRHSSLMQDGNDIERNKRINEIKPRFLLGHVNPNPSALTLPLKNIGGDAFKIKINVIQEGAFSYRKVPDRDIRRDQTMVLTLSTPDNAINTKSGILEIRFDDQDHNSYFQVVTLVYGGTVSCSEPNLEEPAGL